MIFTVATTSETGEQFLIAGSADKDARDKISREVYEDTGEQVLFEEFDTEESLAEGSKGEDFFRSLIRDDD